MSFSTLGLAVAIHCYSLRIAVFAETLEKFGRDKLYDDIVKGMYQEVLVSPEVAIAKEFQQSVLGHRAWADIQQCVVNPWVKGTLQGHQASATPSPHARERNPKFDLILLGRRRYVCLYGTTSSQTYLFYSNYPNDRFRNKLIVGGLCLTHTTGCSVPWHVSLSDSQPCNPEVLSRPHWLTIV
ncbi:hypothetical protein BKA70DRAFT_1237430 [Coprinopsis sp. MPI-PUGE-AT-0042]|nr:hypothetical protein BKA70DRAFT_1237430 [Coprinopsis sp. MPI-PUGE-AT-0042]